MPDRLNRPGGPRRRPRLAAPATAAPVSARRSVRPAARRSGGAGPGATTRISAPRARRRVTGRAVVLAVVLLALGLSYVFPVRVYLAQQAEVSQLRADQQAQQARIDRLSEAAARWSSDEYIRIQARKRLYFGEPGEMLLLPVWEEDQPEPQRRTDPDHRPVTPDPWWDSLWTSIRAADGSTGGESG